MGVEKAFNKYALVYDETRRQFIPCFDDFYAMALELIPDHKTPSILDLGAGTGLVSSMVLERFPRARLVLADISHAMLDQAQERFKGIDADLSFQVKDYAKDFPAGPFDVVISALSIHHLDHEQKQDLFGRIQENLKPGGIFINADQALGKTPAIDQYYVDHWFRKVRESGISDGEIAQGRERMKEDKMSLLDDQLTWLEQIGFSEVNCWYKYYNFVVYSGTKPLTP